MICSGLNLQAAKEKNYERKTKRKPIITKYQASIQINKKSRAVERLIFLIALIARLIILIAR